MKSTQPSIKAELADYFYSDTIRIASRWQTGESRGSARKYCRIGAAAVVDTLHIIPKLALGSKFTWPQDALVPGSLSKAERGMAGNAIFIVGKFCQYFGAALGAAAGVVGCCAGALIGCGGSHWIDLAAGKGWQLGTLAGTAVLSIRELACCMLVGTAAFLQGVLGIAAGTVGNLLDQAVNLISTAPRYSDS